MRGQAGSVKGNIPSQRSPPDAKDRQLYQQILGITSPWSVERVELALKDGQVRVFLQHAVDATWCCIRNATGRARSPRPIKRNALATFGHLPVPNRVARFVAANGLPRARGQGGACSLGRAAQPVYGVVRETGDRLAAGGQPIGSRSADGTDLGRGTRDYGSGGQAGPGAPPSRTGRLFGCGRKIVSERAPLCDDRQRPRSGPRVVCGQRP